MTVHPAVALRLLACTRAAVDGDLSRALEAIALQIETFDWHAASKGVAVQFDGGET